MSFKSEDYLPTRFKSIKEFYDFCIANDPEFENAQEIKDKALNNRFQDTADIDGVKIWERILNITPNTSDTLEDRRFRIISILQKRTPYTWAQLHKMMEALCGKDGYKLQKGYFVLMVYLAMDSQSKLKSVLQMLRDVVPMHILLEITQLLEYNFNVDIFSWTVNNPSLKILPYQQRSYTQSVDAEIASISTQEKKIQILPFQPRFFENETAYESASAVVIKGSLKIQCHKNS